MPQMVFTNVLPLTPVYLNILKPGHFKSVYGLNIDFC